MKLFKNICPLFKRPDASEYRRKFTEEEAVYTMMAPTREIICNGTPYSIVWDKVKTFMQTDGLVLPKNCYKTAIFERKPSMFVAHWDVCLSSKSCFNVLKNRKLSVHFLIDNDGTIYQIMDCNDIGYHAGNWKVNTKSIGVEISNAYYPRYQHIYRTQGFGPRPLCREVEVHGKKLQPFLGFYPVQVEAFKALAKALHKVYDIPLVAPMENNQLVETIYNDVKNATFKGVVSHYHITTRKIDCAGLKLDEVLK